LITTGNRAIAVLSVVTQHCYIPYEGVKTLRPLKGAEFAWLLLKHLKAWNSS